MKALFSIFVIVFAFFLFDIVYAASENCTSGVVINPEGKLCKDWFRYCEGQELKPGWEFYPQDKDYNFYSETDTRTPYGDCRMTSCCRQLDFTETFEYRPIATSDGCVEGVAINSAENNCKYIEYCKDRALKPGWEFYTQKENFGIIETPYGNCKLFQYSCCELLGLATISKYNDITTNREMAFLDFLTILLYLALPVAMLDLFIIRKYYKKSLFTHFTPHSSGVSAILISLILFYLLIFSNEFVVYLQNSSLMQLELFIFLFELLILFVLLFYYGKSSTLPAVSRIKRKKILFGLELFSYVAVAIFIGQYYSLEIGIENMFLPQNLIFTIFPIFNLFQAVSLIIVSDEIRESFMSGVSEQKISRKKEIFSAIIIVSAIFFILKNFTQVPWFFIASICLSMGGLIIRRIEITASNKQ